MKGFGDLYNTWVWLTIPYSTDQQLGHDMSSGMSICICVCLFPPGVL